MRRLRPALVVLALLLMAVIGVWWTLPAAWVPDGVATPERRVVPPTTPAWTRRPASPRGITLDPVSPQVRQPRETPNDEPPEGEQSGLATLSGWIVDAGGTNVGDGWVQARCTPVVDGAPVPGHRSGLLNLRTDPDGFFEGETMGPAVCQLVGRRRDGLLYAQSKPVELWIQPDELLELDLVVPAQRTGGIGVGIGEHPEGIEVLQVHAGTPAWEAGLEAGDLIVAVDGTSVENYDLDSFIGEMTGPEGTDVTFTVKEPGGHLTTHTARRRFLDRSMIR
jgi:membrane-associated protease RseP (regulator of RpoE activity)